MLLGLLVFIGVLAGIALIAGIIAVVVRLVSKSDVLAVTVGTLIAPALLAGSFVYWVLTMAADDAPPGNVLMGNLVAVALVTPIALLASRFAVKALSRHATRDVR